MLPRYYHLKAYYCMLKKSKCLAKWYLKKARKVAEKHGNLFELAWVERHRRVWIKKVDLSDQWTDVSETSQYCWTPRPKGPHLYTWPIVPWMSMAHSTLDVNREMESMQQQPDNSITWSHTYLTYVMQSVLVIVYMY